ncbi:hypothetical protein B0T19DRAFT_138796 [Cercophora scortea]|uniref:Uncharacterized protein n=1 Tax=Cercophora scortea TaxID=314031 RepID=A0AAE0MIM3_9PEZI|nr:hypothetical protein B0T19DRAFT_138796 [Cercophora scortea]
MDFLLLADGRRIARMVSWLLAFGIPILFVPACAAVVMRCIARRRCVPRHESPWGRVHLESKKREGERACLMLVAELSTSESQRSGKVRFTIYVVFLFLFFFFHGCSVRCAHLRKRLRPLQSAPFILMSKHARAVSWFPNMMLLNLDMGEEGGRMGDMECFNYYRRRENG